MGPSRMSDHVHAKSESASSRPRRGSLPSDLKAAGSSDKDKKVPTGPRANPLYKTRLCMNFQSTGSCPYTEKCQFAHGVKELEKWETWRHAHNIKSASSSEEEGKKEADDAQQQQPRSRSESLDKPSSRDTVSSSQDLGSVDFGSPQSTLNWELQTPVKCPLAPAEDDNAPCSVSTNFSLWSSVLDDIENDGPFRLNGRSRASTFDSSTYDNMSQLRDAPTLFSSPPVLGNLDKLATTSHY